MPAPRAISLRFTEDVPAVVRSRLSYAFRVFAAIHGYAVSDESEAAPVRCVYGRGRARTGEIPLPSRYRPRPSDRPGPAPSRHRIDGVEVPLFHGVEGESGAPDWLGEIFEWLSSADERSIVARDGIGRIPYASMIFAREKLSPAKPYASILMAWLEAHLRADPAVAKGLPKAPSPVDGLEHFVLSSHDIDYYYTSQASAARRLLKNLAIAVLASRSRPFFASTLGQMARLPLGRRVGDFLPALSRAFRTHDFRSTLYVIVGQRNRRDANYSVEQVLPRLTEAAGRGGDLALHGSFESIIEADDLAGEVEAMARRAGSRPRGSRQHWLRFHSHEKLFANLERAGLLYDSTLGFSDTVGFRNGAAFAFPPYDFGAERPHEILEIPLAIMDTALAGAAKSSARRSLGMVDAVLGESRRWGWGGISTLWHNPVEPLVVPEAINAVFWDLLAKKSGHRESWVTAEDFLGHALSRYQQAGLLRSDKFQARL
jgi:hypothetical protein